MTKPDILIVDGHAYSWRRLCELRNAQLEAWKKAEARQPTLFALHHDCRPRIERAADDRYREPCLFDSRRE